MKIKTGPQYIKSLKALKTKVYYKGKLINDVTTHPATAPHVRAAAVTYGITQEAAYKDIALAKSHLTGKTISRFTHVHQSSEDLLKKVKLLRVLAHKTGSCFQRCVGFDGINATYAVTYDIDRKFGTDYHERFKKWLAHVQEENIMICGAMTDPKGDRSKGPADQADPDQYVHVVERRADGIVIRGAKVHQTGAVNSHEILVMPTNAMDERCKDYSVVCALPVDAPGVTMIFGRQANDDRRDRKERIDSGNPAFAAVGGEAMIVFDNVFIPTERVFMDGEYEFAGSLVSQFANHHRANYGSCKTGILDVLTGAVAHLCQIQGTAKASHVRDKITEMVHLNETLYSSSVACSALATPTPAGSYQVDSMLANVCKQNVTRMHYEIARLSHDLSGGVLATMPSQYDLDNEETAPLVKKYLQGVAQVSSEERMRIARLIEAMTGGTTMIESMHGAGSPQAQRVMILREAKLDQKVKLAKALAGITTQEPGK